MACVNLDDPELLSIRSGATQVASKKTNKQQTHKHFSDGPCGTIVPGTNPHLSQGKTGQNGDFTVELNRERPVCPRDGAHFVPGRVPFVPRTVPVCPGHRPPKIFMFIGFSCPNKKVFKRRQKHILFFVEHEPLRVHPMNANRAIRVATQRTQSLRGPISVFWGEKPREVSTLILRSDLAL